MDIACALRSNSSRRPFLRAYLEDTELTPELGTRCEELRRAGFRIALDDVRAVTPDLTSFLRHVDIVKLDWPFVPRADVAELVAHFKQQKKLVLAEKVEERADHEIALKAGCELFQGYFFARPQLMSAKKMPPTFAAVFQALNLLINEATTAEIERCLKSAPSLVLQILRLANSSRYTRSSNEAITSVAQAVTRVGTQQLVRWCCILLYGEVSAGAERIDPLLQLVHRRAVFMERAGNSLRMGADFCQAAYLTGLLSLAHISNGLPLNEFVSSLPVSDQIRQGITHREGALGNLLSIAESLERGHVGDRSPASGTFSAGVIRQLAPLFWQQ